MLFRSEGRDLGVAFQAPPGSQASSRGETKDSALLSSRDAGLLEPPERPQDISFISALIFMIFLLLLTLGFVYYSCSSCFRCKCRLFEISLFPEVNLYHYKIPS